ncbi:MAG: 1-phosphofructokinase family hexose kinase [Acidobacteriota bacterium]
MSAIITLTMNPAVEVNSATDQVVSNRKLRCDAVTREPGGGGINVARAIRNLGESVRAIFLAGGMTGDRLTALVSEEGVESHPIRIAGETGEVVNVTERHSGLHFRFVMEGPAVREAEWKTALATIRDLDPVPRYLVASGALPKGAPENFYGRLSAIAVERGFRLIVDTTGPPLRHAIGAGMFLIKPNLSELRELTGNAGGALSDFFLEGAASALVSTGRSGAVVISMGSGGAIVATERGSRRIAAPIVDVASRAGAGDSMVGGIVVALERGLPIEEAALFGIAAGSAAVMMPGTQLCGREDTERLFDELKRRVA